MRTFEEIKASVDDASVKNDAEVLLGDATELDSISTPEAAALAARARGLAMELRSNYAAALEYYHRALALYDELGNSSVVARVTGSIGNVRGSTGNYTAALEHYHRALAMLVELGDRSGVAGFTGNIGLVYLSTGNYPAALEHYHRALAIHEELGDLYGVAGVTTNIGVVHFETSNFPAALEHFQRALAVNEELGNRSWAAKNTGNIGNVHFRTGNYPAALEHYHRALAMHEELGESRSVALVTGNILSAMIESELHAEAAALLQTMDGMQIDEPGVVVSREIFRASLQEHHGNIDEARATLLAALLIAQEHTLASKQAGLHEALRDLALKQNDLARYVEHNNEYTRINEEVNGKETATKLAMQEKQREIDAREKEHAKHMAVLHSALPKHIADRVARGEVVNDSFDNAAVLFLDVVGFTTNSSELDAGVVVQLLQDIFTTFDAICAEHNVMKIKTIGDSYMAVAFPSESHLEDLAAVALAMQASVFSWPHTNERVMFRMGLHVGPVVAGVLGTQRMQYDVWGDTVNVASRMESSGEAGRIHVSQAFALDLKRNTEYRIQNSLSESENHQSHEVPLVTRHSSLVTIERGSFDIKGKGMMRTYWLENNP